MCIEKRRRDALTDNIFDKLNDVQKAAAKATEGPVLVLAGAGSGKTRVLTHRIAYLVSLGVDPRNILAITFTNKAANEMRERLQKMDCSAELMNISTIHSLCGKILRYEASKIGYESNFSIYDEQDSMKVLKEICKRRNIDDDRMKKHASKHISIAKTYALSPDEYRKIMEGDDIGIVCNIYAEYEKILRDNNAMDFDDLLLNVHRLFSQFPDTLHYYQERFKYISIDEFQDINKVQYDIFKMLASKYRNLFVVGDDDQSIYGWRGADVTNILHFSDDYPDAKVFKLEQNYRSTKKILEVANEIISKNLSRHDKKLWTDIDGGVKVELYSGYTENEEAFYVVQQIKALMEYSGRSYADFAILMRLNALSRVFEQECLKYNIPHKVYGGFKFFERKEIKDLIAYMRAVINKSDNEALLRIINTPKRGIGDTTQSKLREASIEHGVSIVEYIADDDNLETFSSATKTKIKSFYETYKILSLYAEQYTLTDFVENMIKTIRIKESFTGTDDAFEREMNIDQFIEASQEYEEKNDNATVEDFLQSVSLTSDSDKESGDAVTLATIHSAKGLEFDTVFVVGLDEGIMPISRATLMEREMEEERRLMYVAVTRAKQRLYLTRAQSRFLFGDRNCTIASRFYNEASELISPKKQQIYTDNDFLPTINPTISKSKDDKEISKYKVGNVVNHLTFGKGMILNIANGNADIIFDKVGKKTLALKYAPLEIIK